MAKSSDSSYEQHHALTDTYFLRSKQVIEHIGDADVTYAVFMRRPVLSAPRFTLEWIKDTLDKRQSDYQIDLKHPEGSWVGAGAPIFYLSGRLTHLIDLETLMLQRIGASSVAAYNAHAMCSALPDVSFIAMDARHCAGTDMAELMAYGASVGSIVARKNAGATGFIGSSTDHTARFFDAQNGIGTMPHALVGYAGSTLRAAQVYNETFPHDPTPDRPMTVLVDYFGQEITDSLEVARAFSDYAQAGVLAFRLDTHGGRYAEGLDVQWSYSVLERNAPAAIRGYRNDDELKHLIGTGVSAAAAWHLRERLDEAGFDKVKIICSSGFTPEKCRVFALANTPVAIIGTGSYLPDRWSEACAVADIIAYDGVSRVKTGREFLIPHD